MINNEKNIVDSISVNGMILAAGAGTRLRPLTDDLPKALATIYGQTLLDIVCNKMTQANINNVAANSHHCAEKISDWLANKKENNLNIKLFHETPKALGTGGPLINAKEHLCKDNADYFVLHNCDIISNINLQHLINAHHQNIVQNEDALVTMCLVEGVEPRIVVDEKSNNIINMRDVLSIDDSEDYRRYSYAGISCFSTKIFDHFPEEIEEYCIIELLLELMKEKKITVNSFIAKNDIYWNDIGSSSCFYDVHKHLLDNEHHEIALLGNNIKNKEKYWSECQKILYLDNTEEYKFKHNLKPQQRAISVKHKELNTHIVVDYHHSMIAKILQNMFSTTNVIKFSAHLLKEQGSSRTFYRIHFDNDNTSNTSQILMLSSAEDIDFERFINYATTYKLHGINVPEIFGIDRNNYSILMEDFGDYSLCDFYFRNCDDDKKIINCYKNLIDELIIFQQQGEIVSEKLSELRTFDVEYLRWETNYFLEYFLHFYCKENLEQSRSELDAVFAKLADVCLHKTEQCLIHRDFQSMNIHILSEDDDLKHDFGIIDFQGGRIGSQFYDLASLINDPYVILSPMMRNELYLYYCQQRNLDSEICLENYLAATLQRNMQALGAYAFLSLVKNKSDYRQYIAPGLRLLIDNCQRICFFNNDYKKLLKKIINL